MSNLKKKKFNLKSSKKLKIIALFSSFLFVTIIILSIMVIINKKNQNIYKNVYVGLHDISGKSKIELCNILDNENNFLRNFSLDIYQDTDKIYTVSAQDIDFKIDIESTVIDVMSFGRTGNTIKDNIDILIANIKGKYMDIKYTYDEKKLNDIILNIDLSLKGRYEDDSYSIDKESAKLYIKRGITGNSIDYNIERSGIVSFFSSGRNNIYMLNVLRKEPTVLDINQMYDELKVDVKDAYVDNTSNPPKYVSEVIGIDTDIEKIKEELKKEENMAQSITLEYDLSITEPNVKLEDIAYKPYSDRLSSLTTYFDISNTAKANNLEIALRYMNGKIIMPGEIFSYNKCIGDTTASKGYVEAGTYKGGNVVLEIGGGICQSVSTLYNVVLMANLGIVERHQHSLPVTYVDPSLDATVYSPVLDFKFKNTRKYPIKIETLFSPSGTINISIYGTKEEVEYDISFETEYLSTTKYTTKYVYDNTLEEGKQELLSEGIDGYRSRAYIIKKLNNKEVSRELISTDTYGAQQKVIKIGTKK